MKAAAVPTIPVLWRAGHDQTAHAHQHRQPRTLCGRPVTPERLAWPTARVCAECRALAEREAATA